jgi:hypothetical protein
MKQVILLGHMMRIPEMSGSCLGGTAIVLPDLPQASSSDGDVGRYVITDRY